MNHRRQDKGRTVKARDVVYTQREVAKVLIERYRPTGRVLDPCAGDGAFADQIEGCLWCEVARGRDFFDWREPVDWIIGNPPYSILCEWLRHSFTLAWDIVYLVPTAKVFGSRQRLQEIAAFGGIVEVFAPWTGRAIGFPFGWSCGAVHLRRDYRGPTSIVVDPCDGVGATYPRGKV